jgi:epoxyqueuosine reductase
MVVSSLFILRGSMDSLSAEAVKAKAKSLGFHKVGIAAADALDQDVEHLRHWLDLGYAADMDWMQDPRRQDIQQVLPGVKSVIVVAMNYNSVQATETHGDAKISRYAQGRDYHKVLGKPLRQLAKWIDEQVPGSSSRSYVDTGPIQEKAWAQAAGVGWIGKNACLITLEYGSWVFLGEVLTTLQLNPDLPHRNYCGTCTRCLVACPTLAIVEPKVVDSRRCLAYQTIENRAEDLPTEIVESQNNWVVGCDICQTCCPYNQRAERQGNFTDIADFDPRTPWSNVSLESLAKISDEQFDLWTQGSAIRRVKAKGLRRNAAATLKFLHAKHGSHNQKGAK